LLVRREIVFASLRPKAAARVISDIVKR
jgi:hypothetical protein